MSCAFIEAAIMAPKALMQAVIISIKLFDIKISLIIW